MYKSSAQISLHLLPGFEFLKIKSVLYDTDNTPKNVTENEWLIVLLRQLSYAIKNQLKALKAPY